MPCRTSAQYYIYLQEIPSRASLRQLHSRLQARISLVAPPLRRVTAIKCLPVSMTAIAAITMTFQTSAWRVCVLAWSPRTQPGRTPSESNSVHPNDVYLQRRAFRVQGCSLYVISFNAL
jgi:hypothetical protein